MNTMEKKKGDILKEKISESGGGESRYILHILSELQVQQYPGEPGVRVVPGYAGQPQPRLLQDQVFFLY